MTASPATTATIIRGVRTTGLAFVLRLGGRLPFLLIAGWLYGVAPLGRFVSATMLVELVGVIATMGLKHGLTAHLTAATDKDTAASEGLCLGVAAAFLAALVLMKFPGFLFPFGARSWGERLFPFIMLFLVTSDILLVIMAYTHDLKSQVTARALVEPWVLTLVAGALAFTPVKYNGLLIAYVASQIATTAVFAHAFRQKFQLVAVRIENIFRLMFGSLPLWAADAVEIGQRRVDFVILGHLSTPHAVGIYYTAFQVGTLVQKMRLSVEPILAPVMARLTLDQDRVDAAKQLDQIRFWLFCTQFGILLALGLQARTIMGSIGPAFGDGALVMILMLVAELIWGSFGIAEIPLLYARPKRNFLIGAVAIGVEVIVAVLLVPRYAAVGAACALISALALAALWKTLATAALLNAQPQFRRLMWPLAAGAVGVAVSLAASHFALGLIAAVIGLLTFLAVYASLLWTFGFNDGDRLLFRRLT